MKALVWVVLPHLADDNSSRGGVRKHVATKLLRQLLIGKLLVATMELEVGATTDLHPFLSIQSYYEVSRCSAFYCHLY